MRIVLVRHPLPAIASGLCYGRLDVPLAATGAEIRVLAADPQFAGAARIWSSPAQRCRQLAAAIAEQLAVEVTVDPRLRELDFGDWEGRPWDDISRADIDRWAVAPLDFAPPRGESGAALIARAEDFQRALRADGQDCVIVSHGGPLKILNALLDGRPPDLLTPAPPIASIRVAIC